jgi:hypothetical protein
MLITRAFADWYDELNLPNSIDDIHKQNDAGSPAAMIKEVKIAAFGDRAILRVMSNGTTLLVFDYFPPRKNKLTKQQVGNFEKLLAKEIKKKVVHEDREVFVIYDDSQEMVDSVVRLFQSIN